MTALADKRDTVAKQGGAIPQLLSLPVAASTKIYQGSLVGQDSAGRAIPATATSADKLRPAVGRAKAQADNSSGAAGAIYLDVDRGVFSFANSASTDALTIADRGRLCFVVDDQTVARTSSNGARVVAGVVEDVDSDGVWVRVGSYVPDAQGIDVHLVSAADLTAKTGYAIKVDSNGKAALAGAGEFAVGILVNAPNTNEIAIVRVAGVARAIGGGVVTRGGVVAADAAGKIKDAVKGSTNTSDAGAANDPLLGSNILGVALETGAADTLFSILITQSGSVPTTAS